MAKAKNAVIAGDFAGKKISSSLGTLYIGVNLVQNIKLDKSTVDSYELVTDEHRKSAASGITRGLVGGALLGPVGLLAGVSAKSKGIYQVAIQFRTDDPKVITHGKRILIEVDDKLYKLLVKNCF